MQNAEFRTLHSSLCIPHSASSIQSNNMRKLLFVIAIVIAAISCRSQHPLEGMVIVNTDEEAAKAGKTLTDEDYKEVAKMLGVDVAAIKAVVDIEAGAAHEGFWTEGRPIINFDLSVYRKRAAANKVDLSKAQKKHPEIFQSPNRKKYGSQQAAQWARLDQAMEVDTVSAIEGTFWGMFQIGGFNYKLCGTKSPLEFAKKMATSERDQLDLFAKLLISTGMVKPLRKHDWAEFARRYNGPSYAKRGYHTRMAKAYAKFKKEK